MARWAAGTAVVGVVLAALFVGTALVTDTPQFCASCHEMQPYYDAWAAGPHRSHWCVDCHVGSGLAKRLAHKFAVLPEVSAHFSGDVAFPRSTPVHVADARCSACHARVTPPTATGFDHAAHASQGPCELCHADAGHQLKTSSPVALAVTVANRTASATATGTPFAAVGGGSADVAGHVTIPCTRCHDLAKTGCQRCHTANHTPRGACENCHAAGAKWVFTHPTQAACEQCHTPSPKHFKPASGQLTPCTRCHSQPGKTWSFAHPTGKPDCASCHALPSGHFQPASGTLPGCTTCHRQPGASWKFAHPGSAADCQSCHTAPAGHSAGQCSDCHHKTGVSFAFAHPATGMPGTASIACVKCHPSGYTTHSCTCHGG